MVNNAYSVKLMEQVGESIYSEDIATVVLQEMIYPGMVECRIFLKDGKVYSAMYSGPELATDFVLVPKQEGK